MRENWDRAISSVFAWEGGFAERENEPGGAVNKGVSLATYRQIHPEATVDDLRAITDAEAASIYDTRYALPVGFYDAPGGLDVVLLHAAVMQGVTGATKLFQASLGLPETGKISPKLFDMIDRPLETARGLIIRLMHAKMHDPNVGRFGPGWSDRYVAIDTIAAEIAA